MFHLKLLEVQALAHFMFDGVFKSPRAPFCVVFCVAFWQTVLGPVPKPTMKNMGLLGVVFFVIAGSPL